MAKPICGRTNARGCVGYNTMNNETTPPATPATSKPKRTRTPKPVKVRTVDPAIQALREQHKAAVAELRKSRKSGAVLAGIVKKLPKLTFLEIVK